MWLRRLGGSVVALLALALVTWPPIASAKRNDVQLSGDVSTFSNVYDYIHCPATKLLTPRSTAELATEVARLSKLASAGRIVRLRATHHGFGSSASFPCPVRGDGVEVPVASAAGRNSSGSAQLGAAATTTTAAAAGAPPIVVAALLGGMNAVLSVDSSSGEMRVQAQILLSKLYEAATAARLSVPLGIVPAWAGLSVAGIIAASAHGSGRNSSSTLCDMVKDITWVDGTGAVHVSKRHSDVGRGLCSGLGLMGVMTELTVQLEPLSHTRIATWHLHSDKHLADDVRSMLAKTPHLLVLWRPDIGRYSGYMLQPEPASTPANKKAVCTILPSMVPPVAVLSGAMLRGWQADVDNISPMSLLIDKAQCAAAYAASVGQPWAASMGDPILNGVGLTNRVQSVECGKECAWTSPLANSTIQDLEFTIEYSDLDAWVADVKRIIKLDLQQAGVKHMRCLPPGFFVIRFGRPSDDLLSTTAGLRDPMYVQHITMRSKGAVGTPSKYEWVQEAYEQLTLCKYNGRPHWGKCFDRTFTHPVCSLRGKYGARLDSMRKLQDQYDPMRLFEPQLYTAAVAVDSGASGGSGGSIGGAGSPPGCVLQRTCYCSLDKHCAHGFVCVPSAAFPEYKVCKPRSLF